MKSIIEEASSIIKAIEKGWLRAECPEQFSVKVLEDAETGFLGLRTTKSAKIALYFEDKQDKRDSGSAKNKPRHHDERSNQTPRRASGHQSPSEKNDSDRSRNPKRPHLDDKEKNNKIKPTNSGQLRPIENKNTENKTIEPKKAPKNLADTADLWSPEMIAVAQEWLRTTLQLMDLSTAQFTVSPSRYHLKVEFAKPLFADPEQERLLFRSYAYLLMQTLRNKYKRPLRGFKVILNTVH